MKKDHKLHVLVGLPRSGKSTRAKGLGFPIVEPDAIRKALHGTYWRPEAEMIVWGIASVMVRSLFEAGHDDVILDATNHTAERRQIWESPDWLIQYHIIDTDKKTCIQRANDTGQEYLVDVIERMASQLVWPTNSPDC